MPTQTTHDAEIFGHGIEISAVKADQLSQLAYELADLGDGPLDIADAISDAMCWPRQLVQCDEIELCPHAGIGLVAIHVYG